MREFKIGDKVRITAEPFKNKIGEICDIWDMPGGQVFEVEFPNEDSTYLYDNLELLALVEPYKTEGEEERFNSFKTGDVVQIKRGPKEGSIGPIVAFTPIIDNEEKATVQLALGRYDFLLDNLEKIELGYDNDYDDEEDEGVRYVATPGYLLQSILEEYGMNPPSVKVCGHIVEDFMEDMVKAGHVVKGEPNE